MKISEINAMLEKAAEAPIESDGTCESWNLLPRIPFPELPDRYKRIVRQRFTVDTLHTFLIECYASTEYESEVANMTAEQRAALPFPAENYISFATLTAGIPANDLDRIIIRARNDAVYTIEAKDEPMIYGNHAAEAFEFYLDEYRAATLSRNGADKEKKPRQTIQKASCVSKFVTNGYYQHVLSDKEYRYAMTLKKNQTAYISLFDPSAFEGLTLNEDGCFMLNDEVRGRIKLAKRGNYEDISKINLPLLHQCYTAAFRSIQSYGENDITVYQPQFFKEAGIETHGEKTSDIMKDILAFSDLWGMLPKYNAMYKVFSLISIDAEKKTMTFAVPYFMRLWEILDQKNHIEKKKKSGELIFEYDRCYHNMLIHSSIVNEKNKPAVNLLYLVVNSLLIRSDRPDEDTYKRKSATKPGQVTFSVTFRTLLNDEPILRARIQSLKSTSDKNKALKRAFTGLYALMRKKTDVMQYFCNVKWDENNIPTLSTLDKLFTITHEGKNSDYQRHV